MKKLLTFLLLLFIFIDVRSQSVITSFNIHQDVSLSYEINYSVSNYHSLGINCSFNDNFLEIMYLNNFLIYSNKQFEFSTNIETGFNKINGYSFNSIFSLEQSIKTDLIIFIIKPQLLYNKIFDYNILYGIYYKNLLFEITSNFKEIELSIGIIHNF